MLGQYLITFREVLEAALITSIILAYLIRTRKEYLILHIWKGVGMAVIASTVIAAATWMIYGGLSKANTKLFEGVAALIAVAVLTSMILWMAFKGRHLREEIRGKVNEAVQKGTIYGLIGLAFVVVFREGFETVLFLIPFTVNDIYGTILGAILGIISALAISFLIFKVGIKIDLKRFFYFSSLLLILLAAGLVGYGIHELIEYQGAIGLEPGWFGTYAFDLDIPKDNIFHHKGIIGSIFAVMFGYSVKMEWGRVIMHIFYLTIFIPLTILAYKKPGSFDIFTKLKMKIKSISSH